MVPAKMINARICAYPEGLIEDRNQQKCIAPLESPLYFGALCEDAWLASFWYPFKPWLKGNHLVGVQIPTLKHNPNGEGRSVRSLSS